MLTYLRVLFATQLAAWFGLTLLLLLGGQVPAGLIALVFVLLSAHTWHCVEMAYEEFWEL